MLIGQSRGYFYLILLEKRAKLLAHDWSSDCPTTAYAIEKLLLKIFCNNCEQLKGKSKNENTRKSAEYWKTVLKKWANERNFQADLEECERDVLNQTLTVFGRVTKEIGDDYEPDCQPVLGSRSVRTIEKASGRQAGQAASGIREKEGEGGRACKHCFKHLIPPT